MAKVMIFAGATEGRLLAGELWRSATGRSAALRGAGRQSAAEDFAMTVYTATEYGGELLRGELFHGEPEPQGSCVEIRTGRLDAEAMRAEMLRQGPDFVVDCTHPHARAVTRNIIAACEKAGCRYLRMRREGAGRETDGAVYVDTMAEAAEFLKHRPGIILATTGSNEAGALAVDELRDRTFLRILPLEQSLKKCLGLGFKTKNIICMQGPFSEDMNRAMLRQTGASWLLAKESGGNSGFAEKLSAAALENAAVVVVRQPREDGGLAMDELQEIITGQKREAPRSVPAPPVRAAAPSGLPGAAEKLRWFPFFLDILNKRVVIAGGGAIALRRVTTLLRFDCAIEIIAPALHGELAALAAANPDYVSVDLRPFEDGDCHGDYLLALTDDRELNHRISLECRKKGIPVSVADRREESTFYFPAVILWDKIVAALSSDGRDHALVKKTADRLRNIIEEGGVHG